MSQGKDESRAKGEAVSGALVSIMLPQATKVEEAAERGMQTFDNVIVAFAIARFQRDSDQYPIDSGAPRPNTSKTRRATGSRAAPIYRPAANGFVLYSVGINGRDDGGRGYDDKPAGDDLVVRMPVPH